MRILLAQNSLYYPAHGGGDKSNRLLLEALAGRGHQCRVVARISEFGEQQEARYLADLAERHTTAVAEAGVVRLQRKGVDVHVVTNANLRAHVSSQIGVFGPDVILASTDDPAQLLLDVALRSAIPVVYLVRATLAVPFGPDCAFLSEAKTQRLRAAAAVVGVSQYVADYVVRWSGIPAVHVPISLLEPQEGATASPDPDGFVTLVNPCAVKGISIFLALADAFPQIPFAAVPTWGTTEEDRAALVARPNVSLLTPVDRIDHLLARTRVLLAPSLWAEARSRIILEAMLRGVPVMAAQVGGIPEAKMGVPYLLPVNPIIRYETRVDAQMVPVAQVPPQDIGPWKQALAKLLTDRAHYDEISRASRKAAEAYRDGLSVGPLEEILRNVKPAPRAAASLAPAPTGLSPEKRKLLALRLRKLAPPSAWFPGADAATGNRLFCFPFAGGGATWFPAPNACPVRLPGRESRLAEAQFEKMRPLVEALAAAIEPYLDLPYAFFGHSMGAAVAFELTRELRRRGRALPRILIASAARAPQFRRGHVPTPAPSDADFLAELRRLGGMPDEVLDDPALLHTILPALRADATLYRNYSYTDDAPLDCPIRAYGGIDDTRITREHLDAWSEQTTANFATRLFPGGHFYFKQSEAFLRALAEDL
ncbi:MAG TPA: thioesterase domain-containing protein [Candidatus Sulfopaludibacter sp.]|jgi:surfactin synthase thioesterase subunit/glycosyltransferase involved in cell wall biosynthesis|nr:thioesterase domain-containing protein [Candidatus Sulfopaludibacter sp.]